MRDGDFGGCDDSVGGDAEVLEERALGDARAPAHLGRGGAGVAEAGEAVEGGVEEASARGRPAYGLGAARGGRGEPSAGLGSRTGSGHAGSIDRN